MEATKAKHKRYKAQQIYTYVSKEDVKRLETICETYGFKSVYELQKHIVSCFLRSVGTLNDTEITQISDEVSQMFKEYADHETNPETNNTFFEGMHYKAKVEQRKYVSPDDL